MKKLHYAWKILFACCLIQFGGLGIVGYTAGIFYLPVSNELNIGIGDLAFAQTIQGIVSALSLLVSGKIINKIKHLNRVIAAGMALVAAGLALQSTFTEVWQWYVTGALMGFGAAFVTLILVPTLINNWFQAKAGVAFGLAAMFSGLGGAVWNSLGTAVIADLGWRTAYIALALLSSAVVIPGVLLIVKRCPTDIGLTAYGAGTESAQAALEAADGIEYRAAVKSKAFYMLLLGAACMAFTSGFNTHFNAFAGSLGLTPQTGAAMASTFMVSTAGCKLILGYLNDKIGALKTCMAILALLICVYLLMAFGNQLLPVLFVAIALSGFSVAKDFMLPSLLTKTIFGQKDFGRILSVISMGAALVTSVSSSLIGYVYDWTGAYTAGIVLCSTFCLLSLISILAASAFGKTLAAGIKKEVLKVPAGD